MEKNQIELIKTALAHYKKRLARYKEQETKKLSFHESFFDDFKNETAKVENLNTERINKLRLILRQREGMKNRDIQDLKLLMNVLNIYQKDLLQTKWSIQEQFPDIMTEKTDIYIAKINKTINEIKEKLQS